MTQNMETPQLSYDRPTHREPSDLIGGSDENEMPAMFRNLVVERTLVFLDTLIREICKLGTFKHRDTEKRRGADAVSVFSAASMCALMPSKWGLIVVGDIYCA